MQLNDTDSIEPNDVDLVYFDDYKIYTIQEESDTEEQDIEDTFPDHWISTNQDDLYIVYKDIKDMSCTSQLCDKLEFSYFCSYMDYAKNDEIMNLHDWSNKEDNEACIVRIPGKKNPTFKQFVSHFLAEIFELFEYLVRTYDYDFGCIELFFELVYQTSSSSVQI